jgi:hypothetical protein
MKMLDMGRFLEKGVVIPDRDSESFPSGIVFRLLDSL